MQAAHPDVGAAVSQYSIYVTDPWGRLLRTGFSMMRFLHGGKTGAVGRREAQDLRALHAHIKGKHSDGSSYFALNPQSFRVVPDTFLDGVLRFKRAIGRELNKQQQDQLYQEYLSLCELFGIPRNELESSLIEFQDYYDNLLLNTMTYNNTVKFLLNDMMTQGPNSPYILLPNKLKAWLYQHTLYPLIRTFTLGFLDPRFRAKHNIPWHEKDEKRYQRFLGIVKFTTKIIPRFLRYHPFALYVMLGGRGVKLVTKEKLFENKV